MDGAGNHVDAAVTRATEILRALAHDDFGFYAGSPGGEGLERQEHYSSLWARDSAHTIIGIGVGAMVADATTRVTLIKAGRASLQTLAERQYPNGQIPNVIWPQTGYMDCGETGGVDGSALFVIALRAHLKAAPDDAFRAQMMPAVRRAVEWLLLRDMNQEGIIDSPEAGDWMDSTFVRSGKMLSNNVLLAEALNAAAHLVGGGPEHVRYQSLRADLIRRINFAFWPEDNSDWRFMVGPLGTPETERSTGSYPNPARQAAYAAAHRGDRDHYISHITYAEFVDKCDVLANVFAVLFEVAGKQRSMTIMRRLHSSAQSLACPISTYLEPVDESDPSGMYKAHVDHFQGRRWRNAPGQYHNAGIWPYIGGYYVWALAKVGMRAEATAELQRLSTSNLQTDFSEWLEFSSGVPGGPQGQAWNAALLLRAAQVCATAPA